MNKKVIIIPTYNEKHNIKKTIIEIIKIYKNEFDILIIDDGSHDLSDILVNLNINIYECLQKQFENLWLKFHILTFSHGKFKKLSVDFIVLSKSFTIFSYLTVW